LPVSQFSFSLFPNSVFSISLFTEYHLSQAWSTMRGSR
jgi:hypothetical protein